jgi:hypothetical protein
MMSVEIKRRIYEMKAGDAAVDGLIGGILAGLGMGAWLLLVGLFSGFSPGELLMRFNPSATSTALVGGLFHLATSAIYGLVYGMLVWMFLRRWLVNQPALLNISIGAVYGLVLWLLAQSVVIPASASALGEFPAWQFGLAHLLYGALVGWWVWRGITKYSR